MDEEIARRILDYLRKHPKAGDTLEGIAKWWMLRQRLTESLEVVDQALRRLKAQGLIFERRGADARAVYVARPPEGEVSSALDAPQRGAQRDDSRT